MANSACVPIFLETSLDTRLVVCVSSGDTVASLKRKIVAEHPVSFPVIGEIIVRAVKTCLKGVMFNLSDSLPVSILPNGINGNMLCYVEAVTTNHERNLRNGRFGEELQVPIGGMIENLLVNEVPHIDEEILADPLQNLVEATARASKKSEKKTRRKNKSPEDTSMRLTEFRKRVDEGFEGNFVQKEPGHVTSKQKREVNAADTNLINVRGENQSANGGKTKKEESGKGEQICIEDGGLADKSDKRRRRKNAKVAKPANGAIVTVGEFHNMKEVAHEAGLDKDRDLSGKSLGQDFASPEIPVNANLMEPNIPNLVEHTPNEELISTTTLPYPNEDGGITNQGKEENGDPTKAPNQTGTNYGIAELLENGRLDDTEKVQPSQDVTQTIGAVLGGVTREKKRRKKTKGFSSDVPSEAPPIREYEPQVEDNTQISVEKDSKVPVKPGNTAEAPNSTPSQLFKSREEPEGNSRADKHIGSKKQPQNDQNPVADDMEECRKEDTNKNVSKEYAHVVGGDPGVVSREKKKRKKMKDAFTEVSTHELSSRESESCKEKASNLVLEKETSEVGAASFINNADEAVKERSRKKRKKTKASSSDMPYEAPPIGEDVSEKADDKVHKSNQIVEKQSDSEIPQKSVAVGGAAEADNSVPCQLDKERVEPDISFPADKDIRFHIQLGVVQTAMADSKEDSGKVMEVIKETDNVTRSYPGIFSQREKRRRNKKKAAAFKRLACEAMENESGQEKGNDLIFEKEINKEAVDTGLINIAGIDPGLVSVEKKLHNKTKAASTGGSGQKPFTEEIGTCKERERNLNLGKEISQEGRNAINSAGGDPGVAPKEKRKCSEIKAAHTDLPPQELSAVENVSSKEGESNLMLEKEASKEADDARFTKNADEVAFPAPKSTDPEDSVNKIASDILADLKKGRPIPPDSQIDDATQMQLLANVAVDQSKQEQYLGLIGETKERRKSGKETSNKTETSQNTMNLATGVSVITLDEKRHKTAKATSPPIRDDEIGSRETFVLASSQGDGAKNQTLDSNMVEASVGDSKKKKRIKQEATNSRMQATTIDGVTDEANCSIKNSVIQTDASGKKKTKTRNKKKSLKEDNVPGDLSFVDKKSSKGKSKEKGDLDKHGDASLAGVTTQNAPNTPEKVQKSGDNFWAENRDKEAFTEGVQTKGSEVLHAPTTERINFIDYFLPKGSDQSGHATHTSLKETKGSKKIQNDSFSKDCSSASVDTKVYEITKKLIGKFQTTEKAVKISKENNRSENSNDKSSARTSMGDGVSKRDDNMKCFLADMAVMSDVSTEFEEEVRSRQRRPMAAVRKVTSKTIGEKMDASRKSSSVFSPGSLPDDVASDTSTRDESKSVKGGLPMLGKEKGRAMMSASSRWKDDRVADDDMPMSQESTRPKKKVNLSSALRSSTSYKKAKFSALQSQVEDCEMIDVVFETQPDLA